MNLEQVLRNALSNILSGKLANEAQVKQAVILPILRALGWDDTNPGEFVPEYTVSIEGTRGAVDYALCRTSPNQLPLVFVETKKLGSVDVAGEDQLFKYATNRGVPLLVLTDGDVWNFYLAMAPGTPGERIVYRAELRQAEKLDEYEGYFERYLEKENVLSGRARQDAERDKQSEENRLTAKNAIPGCWEGMLNQPSNELLEMLVDAVEKNCGIRPDTNDVRTFLKGQHLPAPQGLKQQPDNSRESVKPKTTTSKSASKGSKIIGFVLDGRQKDCGDGNKTLSEILKELQKRDHTFMARFAPKTIGRNRRLVSQDRNNIYAKESLQEMVRDLENGWWMGTNISTKVIRQSIETACEVAGVDFGTRLVLLER